MSKHEYQKGNTFAKGGKRVGAGRPSTEFKNLAARIIDRKELLQWVGRVAAGEETEMKTSPSGEVVEIPVGPAIRLEAVKFLAERAYGKPAQELQHTGEASGRFILVCSEDK